MTRALAVALAALALVGCHRRGTADPEPETAESVTTPSGGSGHVIECETLRDCYAQAGRLCPFGYDVIDARDGSRRATGTAEALRVMGEGLSGGEEYEVTDQETGQRSTVTRQGAVRPRMVGVREMLVECRRSGAGTLHRVGTVEPSEGPALPCSTAEEKAACLGAGGACRYTGAALVCVR